MDKGIHRGQECFLFLHLNVGEYLAACFLAKRSKDERRKWISDHYRDNIWQETLRMAIACETDGCMVQELIAIEQQSELPEGAVFLAAEGIGESQDKRVPQELYDQLWKYAFGNNTYLCEKAAWAIDHLRGGKIDWHVQQLEEYVQSKNLERQMVAYHILLIAFSDDKERMQGLARKYVLYVIRLLHQGEAEDTFDDLANAIQALIPNAEDHELTDAIKSLPLKEMSMNEWKVIENYANAIGEGGWINAEEQALAEEGPKFSLVAFDKQMRQSEQKLIEILIELFGMTSCDKIASCYEYSKISAVMGLWSAPLPEMRLMGKDLERPHSKKLVKAICETVELNETQLKKELYSLLHYVNENRCFVSSDHILNLHLDGEWEKCKGKVAPEVIEEGLHSRSDIMGECAVYMAAYNIETAGVRDLLIRMLRTSSIETVVERAGRVLAACEEKNLAMYAEARLMDDAIPSYNCLYDYLPKRVEDSVAENWLRIIRRGFMGNRYMVSATLHYILSVEPDNIPQRIKDTLISMVEKSFVEWNQKQVKCHHCKEETIVKEDGFCPKCGIGANLPTKNFIEVLTKYQCLTMEQYISLCKHPMSEVRDIARQELKRIWMMDPKKLKAVIAGFEECAYGENIFALILQLPSDVTSVYKQDLQRLGMTTNDKMLVEWIRRLRHLDWVSASERKEMLKKCLTSESDRVRDGAMACWLNDLVR